MQYKTLHVSSLLIPSVFFHSEDVPQLYRHCNSSRTMYSVALLVPPGVYNTHSLFNMPHYALVLFPETDMLCR
jgi:hypothetical protein